MWQNQVDLGVWQVEPAPVPESRFTPGADPSWTAWNEWAPEVQVADFCGELVRIIQPLIIVETGVSQGFITRRIIDQSNAVIYLYEADPTIRRAIPYVMEPESSPDEFTISQADLLLLDSHWPERTNEFLRWIDHGKPDSYCFMHDVNPHAPAGTGHRMLADLVEASNLPHIMFDNPRGSALLYKPDGYTPTIRTGRSTARTEPGTQGSVFIAQLDPGQVDGAYTHSMIKLVTYSMRHPGLFGGYVRHMGGPRIYANRDKIVRHFLAATDCDWLLQIDSDMVFPPDTLEQLYTAADRTLRPIIAGHCYMWRGESGPMPTMWAQQADGGPADLIHMEGYPLGGLVEVAATGAACILVHRSVFETIQATNPDYPFPWYEEGYNGAKPVGEDVMFCVRARQHGFRIYVHTGLDIGHMKPFNMNQSFFEEWRHSRRFVLVGRSDVVRYVTQMLRRTGVSVYLHEGEDPNWEWGNRWGIAAPNLIGSHEHGRHVDLFESDLEMPPERLAGLLKAAGVPTLLHPVDLQRHIDETPKPG